MDKIKIRAIILDYGGVISQLQNSENDICPNECLFVDDSLENAKGAMELGMHAIQFKTSFEFQLELSGKYCITQ